MNRNTPIILTLCLVGCILILASMFMPWWSSIEYEPKDDAPYAKQSLYILPPQYLMESKQLVVYHEVPLKGNIALTAKILTILHILAASLSIFGMITVHSLEKEIGGLIISASGAFCLLSPLIFYLMLPQALWPWFTKISETRGYHFLPYGFETAWGLTYGYFFTVLADILLIIGGAILACMLNPNEC